MAGWMRWPIVAVPAEDFLNCIAKLNAVMQPIPIAVQSQLVRYHLLCPVMIVYSVMTTVAGAG